MKEHTLHYGKTTLRIEASSRKESLKSFKEDFGFAIGEG